MLSMSRVEISSLHLAPPWAFFFVSLAASSSVRFAENRLGAATMRLLLCRLGAAQEICLKDCAVYETSHTLSMVFRLSAAQTLSKAWQSARRGCCAIYAMYRPSEAQRPCAVCWIAFWLHTWIQPRESSAEMPRAIWEKLC
ncbi:hypothetical protein L1887_50571 [Cichorium endivia]|nr:hypothetical protein L1887_50571 [Cichorium endivia]